MKKIGQDDDLFVGDVDPEFKKGYYDTLKRRSMEKENKKIHRRILKFLKKIKTHTFLFIVAAIFLILIFAIPILIKSFSTDYYKSNESSLVMNQINAFFITFCFFFVGILKLIEYKVKKHEW